MTDAGTHVPLIANWPKTIPGKQVKVDLVDFSDFLPTLLDAAQSPLPTNLTLDGQSFLPQITGKQGNPRKWVHCYYRRGNEKAQQWARTQRYKLYNTGKFYDVSQDRLEKNPLQEHYTPIRRKTQGNAAGCAPSISDPRSKKPARPPRNIRSLCQGNNFSQWTNVEWTTCAKRLDDSTNGVVHRFSKGGDIITKETFKDFALIL